MLPQSQFSARSDATLLHEPAAAEAASPCCARRAGAGGGRLQSMPDILKDPAEAAVGTTTSQPGSGAKLPSSTSVPQISQLQGCVHDSLCHTLDLDKASKTCVKYRVALAYDVSLL